VSDYRRDSRIGPDGHTHGLEVVRCAGRGVCRHPRRVLFHPYVDGLPCLHNHADEEAAWACADAMFEALGTDALDDVAGWSAALGAL
jgi:hypothetical protein